MKTTKLTLSSVSKFIGIMGLSLIVFACGKNGSDANHNNNVYNNGYGGTIPGGQTFFQSLSTDITYGLTVNLNFIGQVGYNQGYNQASYNPIISYAGPVAVQGSLQVTQAVTQSYGQTYGGCYLPAGTYNLQTLQPGQWHQAIVSNLVMTAQGPVTAIVAIPQAQVAAKSQLGATWNEVAPVGRLFGNFVIQSVNGVPCNISTLLQ